MQARTRCAPVQQCGWNPDHGITGFITHPVSERSLALRLGWRRWRDGIIDIKICVQTQAWDVHTVLSL